MVLITRFSGRFGALILLRSRFTLATVVITVVTVIIAVVVAGFGCSCCKRKQIASRLILYISTLMHIDQSSTFTIFLWLSFWRCGCRLSGSQQIFGTRQSGIAVIALRACRTKWRIRGGITSLFLHRIGKSRMFRLRHFLCRTVLMVIVRQIDFIVVVCACCSGRCGRVRSNWNRWYFHSKTGIVSGKTENIQMKFVFTRCDSGRLTSKR